MTLSAETTRVSYNGDGATVAFSVTFVFWEADDLRVIHVDSSGTETVWTRGTEYTVSGGDGLTGTVTVETSPTDYTPASGETLVIRSDLDNLQPTSLPSGGAFPSAAVEQRLDQNVRLIQQLATDIGATLLAPESEASIGRIPTLESRKGKLLSFDEVTGDPEAVAAIDLDLATVSPFMVNFLDDDDAAEALTTLGAITAASIAETNTGTEDGKGVTPDALAGSNYGTIVVQLLIYDDSQDCATGDGAGDTFFRVPSTINGFNLVGAAAQVQTAGTTGTMDIQVRNVTQAADMLSTVITIDSAETDSSTAAAAAVIDTSNDDVATGDQIRIDVDAVQTTPAKGLLVELQFRLP